MASKAFYIEHPVGDTLVEYEYEVEAEMDSPYVPAKTSGPPELCYPAEGGETIVAEDSVRRRRTDLKVAPWEPVTWENFLESLVVSMDLKNDPDGKFIRRSAVQKAAEHVEAELAEACSEALRDSYYDHQDQDF